MRLTLMIVVGFLALLGIGATVFHYIEEPYNPGFLEFPLITAFHVILGGVYLALAPFQFVQRIRTRWLNYHHWSGRLLVVIGLVVGATALFMVFVFPMSGWPESVMIGLFGGLFLVALVLGFVHVRAGRVALHREWMMRAFALGLSIATMRVFFVPALIWIGNPTDEQIAFLSVGSFTLAFLLHSAVAELWIRHTRKHEQMATGAPNVGWRSSVPKSA